MANNFFEDEEEIKVPKMMFYKEFHELRTTTKFYRKQKKIGHILRIRKRELTFQGYITRKEGYENLTRTAYIECERSKGKLQVTYLRSLGE